jgi:plastocyanin
MTRRRTLLVPLAALAVAAAGCGSSGDNASGGSGASGGGAYGSGSSKAATTRAAPATASSSGGLALKAVESDGLSFDHRTLTAKAGKVTITMTNPSGDSQPHAIALEGPGVSGKSGEIAQPGATSAVTATLKPGTYTFFCPVGAHRQAGMEGTLTVQ